MYPTTTTSLKRRRAVGIGVHFARLLTGMVADLITEDPTGKFKS